MTTENTSLIARENLKEAEAAITENWRLPEFIGRVDQNGRHQWISRYRCGCGELFNALEYNIRSMHTKSCGCRKSAFVSASRMTHRESRPRSDEYRIWSGMKSRCLDESCSSYSKYGKRGIQVCREWIDSFEAFLSAVGRRPTPDHSLDRIDNNGHYEPGNVHWATKTEQARNRRSSRIIELGGKRQCLKAWADDLSIAQSTLIERLQKWPLNRALTESSARGE